MIRRRAYHVLILVYYRGLQTWASSQHVNSSHKRSFRDGTGLRLYIHELTIEQSANSSTLRVSVNQSRVWVWFQKRLRKAPSALYNVRNCTTYPGAAKTHRAN